MFIVTRCDTVGCGGPFCVRCSLRGADLRDKFSTADEFACVHTGKPGKVLHQVLSMEQLYTSVATPIALQQSVYFPMCISICIFVLHSLVYKKLILAIMSLRF